MRRNLRPLTVVLYAAFIGLLLASYLSPLQQIVDGRAQIAELEHSLARIEADNETKTRKIEALQTPEGIERAARERYGMISGGEEVYLVPKHMRDGDGGG